MRHASIKNKILSLCLVLLLLTACAGLRQDAANSGTSLTTDASVSAGTHPSVAEDAATEQTERGTASVSDLSAEITLQIASAPEGFSAVRDWDAVLSGFYETYPNVTVRTVLSDVLPAASLSPGLVLARPEELLPGGASDGAWQDLSALYMDDDFSALLPNAVNACLADDGHYYAYPFAAGISCMAVNRHILEETGALQYINEETLQWSTADFLAAVQLLSDAGYETVLSIPCAEEDSADTTRSFLLNLYGGSFAMPAATGYEVRSENNLQTFETLKEQPGIVFAPEQTEADAREAFWAGDVPMLASWDFASQLAAEEAGNEAFLALCFPVSEGAVQLPGELYCLAIPDTGSMEERQAAEALLAFLTSLPYPAKEALLQDGCFPAVRNLRGLYDEETETARSFALQFIPHFGFYERFAPDLTTAAAAWNRMLAQIAAGVPAEQALKNFNPH